MNLDFFFLMHSHTQSQTHISLWGMCACARVCMCAWASRRPLGMMCVDKKTPVSKKCLLQQWNMYTYSLLLRIWCQNTRLFLKFQISFELKTVLVLWDDYQPSYILCVSANTSSAKNLHNLFPFPPSSWPQPSFMESVLSALAWMFDC